MARIDLPQSRLKARKRRRRVRLGIVLAVFVLLVFGVLVGLSYAPFLRVTAVAVSGAQTADPAAIQKIAAEHMAGAYGYVFAKNNIFLYPKAAIAAALMAQYPQFKSVEVSAKDFHTVAVAVDERQPAARWCGTTCFVMDEDGVVYAADQGAATSSPWVSYSGGAEGKLPWQYLPAEQFKALFALVGALSQTEPGNPVVQVAVDSNNDVRAYFKNNFVLMFSLNDESGDIFERFTLALKSAPFAGKTLGDFEYLDLRFGDKLYYKLKGQ